MPSQSTSTADDAMVPPPRRVMRAHAATLLGLALCLACAITDPPGCGAATGTRPVLSAAGATPSPPSSPPPTRLRPSVSQSEVNSTLSPMSPESVRARSAADTALHGALPRGPSLPKPTASPNARMYLAWHAPFGQPRASEMLSAACGDTSSKDTLYMSFDPGRGTDHFLGLTATVYFWAAGSDSLGAHWKFGDREDFHGLEVQFLPQVSGFDSPWPEQKITRAGYSFTRASGKLRMILALGRAEAVVVKGGTQYVFARLLVPRPAAKTPGCDRPMCIEWAVAGIAYDFGDAPEVNRGSRFAAWNSPGGRVCDPMRRFAAPVPWAPPMPAGASKRKPRTP